MAQAHRLAEVNDKYEANVQKIAAIVRRYNPKLSPERVRAIGREIYDMSIKYDNLDPDLICATITHESARTWDSTVVSAAGAMGLMQIMPATGAYLAALEGIQWTTAEEILFNPIYNIRLGCRYLSMLIDAYEVDGGLAAYNSGPKRAERWLASNRNNQVLYRETRGYIPAVLRLYDQFRNSEGLL
ncbi:MAG: transglycosylase SLT domain-containing protein [candidate division KSB1 bacterium]|nr:transglycosylase SLT domain-containing protein [candidate division KSB1 bacterium]